MIFNILGQIVIGWLLADFLSGVFHWWQDRWPKSTNRILGNYLILPSRLHHLKPHLFTTGSFMYRNGFTFFGVIIAGIPLIYCVGLTPFAISLMAGGFLSTQVHYLTHRTSKVNRFGRLLQASGIIQSPKHHALHHRSPNEVRYCVLTDYLNPFLDDLRVWSKLEDSLGRLNIKLSMGK